MPSKAIIEKDPRSSLRCPWPMTNGQCGVATRNHKELHRNDLGDSVLHFECLYGHRFHASPAGADLSPCDCPRPDREKTLPDGEGLKTQSLPVLGLDRIMGMI